MGNNSYLWIYIRAKLVKYNGVEKKQIVESYCKSKHVKVQRGLTSKIWLDGQNTWFELGRLCVWIMEFLVQTNLDHRRRRYNVDTT